MEEERIQTYINELEVAGDFIPAYSGRKYPERPRSKARKKHRRFDSPNSVLAVKSDLVVDQK